MEYTKKYTENLEKQLKELKEKPEEKGYVILKKTDKFEWTEFTAMIGKSPEDAIAKVVEGRPFDGVLLAIPSEYWARQVDFDEPIERIS